MKTLDTIQYDNLKLDVLIEQENESSNPIITYFINGYEVTDTKRVQDRHLTVLTALASNMLKGLGIKIIK